MRELFETVERWDGEGHRMALATVVGTWRSSPRPTGSAMVVCEDGQSWGSVSGGCVEGAVIEAARAVIADHVPQLLEFGGLDQEQIWEIGLSCGGSIRVFVEPCPLQSEDPSIREAWRHAFRLTAANKGYVWATGISGKGPSHGLFPGGSNGEPRIWEEIATRAYEDRSTGEEKVDDQTVFFDVRRPADRLVIVGGVHIAIPLVRFAQDLGFTTVVVEPRAAFAAPDRFPVPPDSVLQEWPEPAFQRLDLDNDTFAVVLTHDPKIDDQALRILVRSDVRYIGALGSRSTQEQRRQTLTAEGFTEAELDRIHGPVGLDIGALTPGEIALSIIAEIVQVKRARPS